MMSLCFVMVPVLLDLATDPTLLVSQWRHMYWYGHKTMPVLAIGTFVLYASLCIQRSRARRPWGTLALAAATTMTMLPFTWFIMAPTNNTLFKLDAEGQLGSLSIEIEEAKELVVKWAWLHFTRCLFPLSGALIGTFGQR
jgi:hypothetical protein